MKNSITDIAGIRVGHFTNDAALTGCTVIICENGAVGGVDISGGAPGTRETALLYPTRLVKRVNAILLTGGSAFGLSAADGVMRYLAEKGCGYDTGLKKIPIVPSAVIFDLHIGDKGVAPSAEDGYRACLNASIEDVIEGSVGAGTGATVGKLLGLRGTMRGGLGTASIKFENGLIVGVLVVVNAFGDVRDFRTNQIIAGARSKDGNFIDTVKYLMDGNSMYPYFNDNSTIGVVVTNTDLDKTQTTRVAQMAQIGVAQVITPSQTLFDGDIIFALSTGEIESDPNFVGIIASELVKHAVINAIKKAKSVDNILSYSDLTE